MINNKCKICNKEFKFISLLERHLKNKKKCKVNIPNINIETITIKPIKQIPIKPIETITIKPIKKIPIKSIETIPIKSIETISIKPIETIPSKPDTINITENIKNNINENKFNEYLFNFVKYIKNNNIDSKHSYHMFNILLDIVKDNNDYNINFTDMIDNKCEDEIKNNIDIDIDIDIDIKDKIKSIICINCNSYFASKSSLSNHKKYRCKRIPIQIDNQTPNIESHVNIKPNEVQNIIPKFKNTPGTSFNDLVDVMIQDSDNIEINNNSHNITNNNPITNNITINAFGYESLEHITTNQFIGLFSNINNLQNVLYNLSKLVYLQNNNKNFIKHNKNKNTVSYLNSNMDLVYKSENDFIKDFELNIKKLCIELFHNHKNDISLDDLIEYMKSFLLLNDTYENKINHIELKNQIKSIMEYVFRDKDINEVIKNIQIEIKQNEELKKEIIEKHKSRNINQTKKINEYYIKPKLNNKDEKNLYKIKNLAFHKNLEDKKKYIFNTNIDNDINRDDYKYTKQIDRNTNIPSKPIIVKFDDNGFIIDDRL